MPLLIRPILLPTNCCSYQSGINGIHLLWSIQRFGLISSFNELHLPLWCGLCLKLDSKSNSAAGNYSCTVTDQTACPSRHRGWWIKPGWFSNQFQAFVNALGKIWIYHCKPRLAEPSPIFFGYAAFWPLRYATKGTIRTCVGTYT